MTGSIHLCILSIFMRTSHTSKEATIKMLVLQYFQLSSSMQMVYEPLSISCKHEFVDVSFLGASDHDSSGSMCSPRVVVFTLVDYQGRQCKACSIDIG